MCSYHRYFIEPISNDYHLRTFIIKRFLRFIENIKSCKRICSRNLLNIIQNNTLSTTGSNLRYIMFLLNKNHINDLKSDDVRNLKYSLINSENEHKIVFLKELLKVKYHQYFVNSWNIDEIDELITHISTSG